jgi:hypothetical protein
MVDNAIDLDADSVARSCVGDTPSNGSEVGAHVMRQFRPGLLARVHGETSCRLSTTRSKPSV